MDGGVSISMTDIIDLIDHVKILIRTHQVRGQPLLSEAMMVEDGARTLMDVEQTGYSPVYSIAKGLTENGVEPLQEVRKQCSLGTGPNNKTPKECGANLITVGAGMPVVVKTYYGLVCNATKSAK